MRLGRNSPAASCYTHIHMLQRKIKITADLIDFALVQIVPDRDRGQEIRPVDLIPLHFVRHFAT